MFNRISKFVPVLAGLTLFASILYAASTAINLTDPNRSFGVLPVIRAGTGAASTSAGYALAGPLSGAAAAYSFKSLPSSNLFWPLPNQLHLASCLATGSSVTCIGEDVDNSYADTTATSTLPSYTQAWSDTTGASCTDYPDSGAVSFYSGRNLTTTYYAALTHTNGGRMKLGNFTGSDLTNCASDYGSLSDNTAYFLVSSTEGVNPGNIHCITTDGDGVNVEDTDSGVAANTSFHTWRVWHDNSNSRVKFFVDDMATPICTNSTQIPVNQVMNEKVMQRCVSCGGIARGWNVASHEVTTTPF